MGNKKWSKDLLGLGVGVAWGLLKCGIWLCFCSRLSKYKPMSCDEPCKYIRPLPFSIHEPAWALRGWPSFGPPPSPRLLGQPDTTVTTWTKLGRRKSNFLALLCQMLWDAICSLLGNMLLAENPNRNITFDAPAIGARPCNMTFLPF